MTQIMRNARFSLSLSACYLCRKPETLQSLQFGYTEQTGDALQGRQGGVCFEGNTWALTWPRCKDKLYLHL